MPTNIAINSSLYKKLQKLATAQKCDLSVCLEKALDEYIETYGNSANKDSAELNTLERAFFLSVAE